MLIQTIISFKVTFFRRFETYIPDHFNSNYNIFLKKSIVHDEYDECNTMWDDGEYSNYWDKYIGEDNDGDSIVDTPYPIPGGNNVDRFPCRKCFSTLDTGFR